MENFFHLRLPEDALRAISEHRIVSATIHSLKACGLHSGDVSAPLRSALNRRPLDV